MVYQDPQTALNPAYRIGDQIAEAVNEHTNMQPQEVRERVLGLLRRSNFLIQLASMRDIPELSVDNSNVVIAMAFDVIQNFNMDEPTTGLDVKLKHTSLILLPSSPDLLFLHHSQPRRRSQILVTGAVMYGTNR